MELYVTERKDWRNWLENNHSSCDFIWLVYYKKSSGKPRISYNDAVEEAICFGWIDGKIKKINEEYYIQRFSPRRQGSRWSTINIERAGRMVKEGLMTPAGFRLYNNAVVKPELVYNSTRQKNVEIPSDLLDILQPNKNAFECFMKLSASRQKLYILWIEDARKEITRKKRMLKVLEFSEKNNFPSML